MRQKAGTYRKVHMLRVAVALLVFVSCCACGVYEGTRQPQENLETAWEGEITVMHEDAGDSKFEEFMEQVQDELHMKIHVLPYPKNAESRHAKVSSLLAAGDDSVDVFTVNDEMINAFKHEGYLEPLGEDVMAPATAAVFPQEYLHESLMADGQIYSAPYMLDVLVLWVNEEWLKEAGIADLGSKENLYRFLSYDWGDGRYAYGGAWEKTYVFNEIGEFINLFGGDYYDWENEKTRQAVQFLKECVDMGYTSKEQVIDQYEQMNQKFIDGKYGMVFMYSGSMEIYSDAQVYGEDKIHMAPLTGLGESVTYVGTWQYALNKASGNKEAAKKFMSYVTGRGGSRLYAECMNRMPARSDLLEEEDLDITGYKQFQDYLSTVTLQARPIPANSVEYLEKVGGLFQQYIFGEISLDNYCEQMQKLVG